MLLLSSGPAVLFPRRALKLLKLTYYLLDWANMFVFCVHVCASACSLPIFPFILIECSVVELPQMNVQVITCSGFLQRPFFCKATIVHLCLCVCVVKVFQCILVI